MNLLTKTKFFGNFKVSSKLITAFILVSLVTCLVGVVGTNSMKKINTNSLDLYKEAAEETAATSEKLANQSHLLKTEVNKFCRI
ncbi:MCP four helix bundle domain-containing protein [Clostridium grantii]|uniref:Four helix bundle sensory module for signal transduction n=1 Tax=Clostridium grantii DSM 8605 TaxID=1121316 RepID=A0A1M5VEN1_9CLOT|nr:MCP four helix bundle domain-containing protein [Clostridium grantii]SHH73676.1 Four helix bundle sensory module for signal transduction [Clostridium grantii DSM 8605]